MKKLLILTIFIASCLIRIYSQESLFFEINPQITVPLGQSSDNYTIGGGAEISINYHMPFASWLTARGGLDYIIAPTKQTSPLNLITISGGLGVKYEVTPSFFINGAVMGGYSLGIYASNAGGSPYFGIDGGFGFNLNPSFSLGIRGGYRHNFAAGQALYQGIHFNIGTTLHLGGRKREPRIKIEDIELNEIFPVFYGYYDDHALGHITIANDEKGTVSNVQASFFVPQYMDKPKVFFQIDELTRNEIQTIPVYGLFSDSVLSVTEGTKISAELIVEYTYAKQAMRKEVNQTLQLYDRNAMSWDDDRKAAAFITAKDPEVLRFSKNIAGVVRADASRAVNLNFRIALALFEALKINGINYVIDPQTPYTDFSINASAVDYLQFPVQTIDYQAGDCDDLSILYASLLESTGIETAFITVPGHIYIAFNLDLPPGEAKRLFRNPGDLIYEDDKTWLPVEITLVQRGFIDAWEEGAKEWREYKPEGEAQLILVHEAWDEYKPVGITGISKDLNYPDQDQVLSLFRRVIGDFVEDEISDKVAGYTRQLASDNSPRILNKLGILYAQYGIMDKAKDAFLKASRQDYSPAYINLGNIQFINKDFESALKSFQNALDLYPGSVKATLGFAKTNYELENYAQVKTAYEEIQRKSPDTAARFSYLGESRSEVSRASSAMIRETVLWGDEE